MRNKVINLILKTSGASNMKWPFSSHPRQSYIAGSITGLCFIVVGCMTLYYPPQYLENPIVWGWVFIYGGCITFGVLVFPSKLFAAIAGGFTVGASLFRSFSIYRTLGWGDAWRGIRGADDVSSGFITFGTMWFMIATLLWLGWPVMAAGLLQGKHGSDLSG